MLLALSYAVDGGDLDHQACGFCCKVAKGTSIFLILYEPSREFSMTAYFFKRSNDPQEEMILFWKTLMFPYIPR